MDKSIPHYKVLMVKNKDVEYKEYHLKDEYEIVMYEDGMDLAWAEIETSVGEFESVSKAKEHFHNEFISSGKDLSKYCYFVKDKKGNILGTASIWFSKHLEDIKYRIHWVAVRPEAQGNGLAKALISRILTDLTKEGEDVYLSTHSWSYKAINIYSQFGFKPYKGKEPNNWTCDGRNFEVYNEDGWALISNMLKL